MPLGLAERLGKWLQHLDVGFQAKYPAGNGDMAPYPRFMTAISPGGLPGAVDGRRQLVPLDLVFSATPLRSAPREHRDVVPFVCVIGDPTTLAERRPETPRSRQDLAVRLFSVLGCVWALT